MAEMQDTFLDLHCLPDDEECLCGPPVRKKNCQSREMYVYIIAECCSINLMTEEMFYLTKFQQGFELTSNYEKIRHKDLSSKALYI